MTYVGEVEGGIYPIKQNAGGVSMQDILREALQSGIPQIDSVQVYEISKSVTLLAA